MCTNTCMFCVVYSSIQKFTIITIMKTAIFITIIFISILSNYLNYRTALVPIVGRYLSLIFCKHHKPEINLLLDSGIHADTAMLYLLIYVCKKHPLAMVN